MIDRVSVLYTQHKTGNFEYVLPASLLTLCTYVWPQCFILLIDMKQYASPVAVSEDILVLSGDGWH